jgi:hypothetical protein
MAMTSLAIADPLAEGFRKITGVQIRQAFSGHTFSDDVHFSFRYKPDGVIDGEGMGKKVSRKWSVANNQLCVTDELGENCHDVWKKGASIKMMMVEGDLAIDGFMK